MGTGCGCCYPACGCAPTMISPTETEIIVVEEEGEVPQDYIETITVEVPQIVQVPFVVEVQQHYEAPEITFVEVEQEFPEETTESVMADVPVEIEVLKERRVPV